MKWRAMKGNVGMINLRDRLRKEFIEGTKPFDWIFLGIGLALQIIAIMISAIAGNDPYIVITAISGFTGVISVVLCSRGKLSQYFFGYIQLFTYLFGVAIPLALWGEVIENIFYVATMVIGVVVWKKRYSKNAVKSKEMTANTWSVTFIVSLLAIVGVAFVLPKLTKWFPVLFPEVDPQPWMDSITTVIPLFGQMLMCFGYKDQWVFWFVEDVMSLIMFAIAGNVIMVAQYIFWTANCIYGWVTWNRLKE